MIAASLQDSAVKLLTGPVWDVVSAVSLNTALTPVSSVHTRNAIVVTTQAPCHTTENPSEGISCDVYPPRNDSIVFSERLQKQAERQHYLPPTATRIASQSYTCTRS
eukprot:scpid84690/ scgid4560/ 